MFRPNLTDASNGVGVTIVAPVRNEVKNLPWFISRIPSWVDEVLFIDGSSTDGSQAVIQELMPSAKLLIQPGRGKGDALAFGLVNASNPVVIAIDTDGSMDPQTADAFVIALQAGADVVKGSRYLPGGGSDDLTKLRDIGNKLLTAIANFIFRQQWSELCYGYFALWHKGVDCLDMEGVVANHRANSTFLSYGSGFEIETLTFCRSVRNGLKVVEIPSYEKRRVHGQSNLRTFRDGFRVVWGLGVERTRRATKIRDTTSAVGLRTNELDSQTD